MGSHTKLPITDTRTTWLPGAAPGEGRIARARLYSAADIAEVERYPFEQLLPGRTLYECIRSAAQDVPDKPAMIWMSSANVEDPARHISYRELLAGINRTANLLRDVSGAERSSTALILPMLPEGLMATWAAATAGVAVPINPYLEARYVVSILNAAKVTVLITTTDAHGDGIWNRLDEIIAHVPSLKKVLLVDAPGHENDFGAAIAAYPDELGFVPAAGPDDEAMYMPTGGTTGTPKLVRMSQWGQLVIAWNVGALMGSRPDGVVGHGMPNFHCGGAISLGLRTILFGQTLLTLTRHGFRDPGVVKGFWAIAKRYRMTSLLATPTTAAAILAVQEGDANGHCIEDFHCGGSAVPQELARRFHKRFGIWLRENWGMTEIHGTTTGHPDSGSEPVIGSVGLTLPHYQTRVIEVDEENRFVRLCAPGEPGLLVLHGPSMMLGYGEAALDAEYFVKDMPDGLPWGNTGDLGAVDENGYVWVYGRAKDLIIRGGHNIDPRLIEEVLVEHEDVQMAAAIGRPDPLKGEMPVAYVELRQGAAVSAAELVAFCREHVQERAAVPKEVIIIDHMPLTAVGKVSKPALRIDAMRRTAMDVARKVCGEAWTFEVEINESAARPEVCIRVHCDERKEDLSRQLHDEFSGFTFKTVIEIGH